MKRFLGCFFVGLLTMMSVVYGAEREVVFLREKEVVLQNKPIHRDGKWMVSLDDLERLTDTHATESGNTIVFRKPIALDGVELKRDVVAHFMNDGTMLEKADGSYQMLESFEFRMDDMLYLPCRDYAEALGFEVQWSWNQEKEYIQLLGIKMPDVTLNVVYDAKDDKVSGVIKNMEPQTFLYGGDFSIERKTEFGWEEVKGAGPIDIDDVGYHMNAKRHYFEDGITNIEYQVHTELPAGEYRMCLPFSYTYYIKSEYVDYLNQKIENGDLCDLDWNYYYSTHWGKPDFYFEGEGIKSTYDWQKITNYILYGGFKVE